jgi:hypothetical protein
MYMINHEEEQLVYRIPKLIESYLWSILQI